MDSENNDSIKVYPTVESIPETKAIILNDTVTIQNELKKRNLS